MSGVHSGRRPHVPKEFGKTTVDRWGVSNSILGTGASGVVVKGMDTESGRLVAIKKLPLDEVNKQCFNIIRSEIDVLKALTHPNIIEYVDAKQTPHNLYIIMELMEYGSLSHIIKQYGTFPDFISGYIMSEVLQGVSYIHYSGLIHRDIKGGNILLSGSGHVKVADFGVCSHTHRTDRRRAQPENTITGTPCYIAPEVIELSYPAPASDIWSVGCTVCELITGLPPYASLTPLSALYHTVNDSQPPLSKKLSDECKSFVLRCFCKDPTRRATAIDLVTDPWIVTCTEQFKSLDLTLGPDIFSKECLPMVREGATPLLLGNTNGSHGFQTATIDCSLMTAVKNGSSTVVSRLPQQVVEKGIEDGVLGLIFNDNGISSECIATVLEKIIDCGFADKIVTHPQGIPFVISQVPSGTFRYLTILARIEEALPCIPLRDVLFEGAIATTIASQQLPLTIYTARLIELQLQCTLDPGRKTPSKVVEYLLDNKKYIHDTEAPMNQNDPVDKCGSRVVATVLRCFYLILDETQYKGRGFLGCFPGSRSHTDLKTKHAIWKASEFMLKTHPECCDTAAKLLPLLFNKKYSNGSICCMLPLIQQIAVSGVSSRHNEHILRYYLYVIKRKETTEEMRGVILTNLTAWMSCSSVLASAITNFPICDYLIDHWCGIPKKLKGAEGLLIVSSMCVDAVNLRITLASNTSFRCWIASLILAEDVSTVSAAAKLVLLIQNSLPEGCPKISPMLQHLNEYTCSETIACVVDEIRNPKK